MHPRQEPTTAIVAVEENTTALTVTGKEKKSYWARVATKYGALWRLLLIVTALFAVLFVLLFSRSFTYDSILCFFRDVQSAASYYPTDYDTVYATYEEGECIALSYRGGIAFVNAGGVEVYSPNGERSLDLSLEMEQPRAVSSRKYLVIFDHGKKGFAVTNSYAELYRGETEFPILGAAVADDGHFALITTSDETLSQVLIYDNNFNLVQRFARASATVGVAIADNGAHVALLGATAEAGRLRTVLDVYAIGKTEPNATLTLEGEMPLSIGFTNNKNAAVLTDKALRVCRLDGTVREEHAYTGDVAAFCYGDEGVTLVTKRNGTDAMHDVLMLGEKGKVLYSGEHSGDVLALAMGKEEIFILQSDRVTRLDIKKEARTDKMIERGATGLIFVDEHAVRVIYPAKAEHVSFE